MSWGEALLWGCCYRLVLGVLAAIYFFDLIFHFYLGATTLYRRPTGGG